MKHFLRLLFFAPCLIGLSAKAQLPVMQQINAQVCDSLQRSPVPLADVKPIDVQILMSYFILKQMNTWNDEVQKFVEDTGREISEYEWFFIYQLEINCPIYRSIASKVDKSFEDDPVAQGQYLASRKFMLGLMDGLADGELKQLFSRQLATSISEKQLANWKGKANAARDLAILKLTAIEGQANHFEALMEDYRNRETLLKLEIQFKQDGGFLIESISERN